ncbi:uncharacterized protein BDW70DRAFT_127831 [Aspergillus foveolatus]|uniref:uncharacterized protein n=1 Tax=Aspergillus foveolatus TaxID=210207 RepID=UPI003CCD69B4
MKADAKINSYKTQHRVFSIWTGSARSLWDGKFQAALWLAMCYLLISRPLAAPRPIL